MSARITAVIVVTIAASLVSIAQAPIRHPMLPREAENYLASLIPSGKKNEVIRPLVFTSKIEITNVQKHCSSSGTVEGNVDDSGNFNGRTNSSSNCFKTAIRHHTLFLALPLPEKNSYAVLIAHCAEKWVWNHCDDPPTNTEYPVVIEKEKHGFNLYAATARRVGGKMRVARYEVLEVDRVVLPEKPGSAVKVAPPGGEATVNLGRRALFPAARFPKPGRQGEPTGLPTYGERLCSWNYSRAPVPAPCTLAADRTSPSKRS
jgi:hypothetical protein